MDWYFDPELSVLRRTWAETYAAWEAIRPEVDGVSEEPLTAQQRTALTVAMDAERAYLERMMALRDAQAG